MPICFRLLEHCARRAASRAAWTAGKSKAIRTPMIAMTTSSSIRVKAVRCADGRKQGLDDLFMAACSRNEGEPGPGRGCTIHLRTRLDHRITTRNRAERREA